MKEYLLKFNRLENGKHSFNYTVSDDFFKHFEEGAAESGDLDVNVVLEKGPMVMTLTFTIEGEIDVPCDRCLDLINFEIETEKKLIVKFGAETTDISDVDEIMVLSENETQLDLSQHIFEFINLSIPYRVTHAEHSDEDCNPEMIAKLESYLINNDDTNENEATDPRWDALKSFLNN